jgi:hypothetical protein
MAIGTGGDALIAALRGHGIDTVFGLPGAQTYGLFDAIHRSDILLIGARHEQACGYMAFGYARATGKPSAFTVVPGPGVLNAGAAALRPPARDAKPVGDTLVDLQTRRLCRVPRPGGALGGSGLSGHARGASRPGGP